MNGPDLADIAELVKCYYLGMVRGSEELLRGAFAPDARFQGVRDGVRVRRDLDAFIAVTKRQAMPQPEEDGFGCHIVSIDLSGPIAVAKVSDLYLGRRYIDYLTLIRDADGWRIVNKTFHAIEAGDA